MKQEIDDTLCDLGYDKIIRKLEKNGWTICEAKNEIDDKDLLIFMNRDNDTLFCFYKTAEDVVRFIDKLRIFAENNDDEIAQQIISDMKKVNSEDDFMDIIHKYALGLGKCACRDCFILYGHLIPNKDAYYNVFKSCLSDAERYSYNALMKPEIIEEVRKYNSADTVDNQELINLLDNDGYLTVYHGHCKKTLRNSNSWTIKKDMAHWFGNRNAHMHGQEKYYVVTGKVKLSDIIAYIMDRNEFEVLVLNKDVKNKTKEFFDRKEHYKAP